MRRIAKTLLVTATLCLACVRVRPHTFRRGRQAHPAMLDCFVNPDHAPLFVALAKG